MNVAQLIEILRTKVQTAEIEFVIVEKNGMLVAADVSEQAKAMVKVINLIGD